MWWAGWGKPDDDVALGPELRALLGSVLGVQRATPAVSLDHVCLPVPRLKRPVRARLAAVVGEERLRTDRLARIAHTRGKSTPDLLRIRSGDASDAPDAVLEPGSHEQVAAVLGVCAQERVAVVPYGGGTSVVGGLAPDRRRLNGVIALDLRRLKRLLELDEISRTATLEPGLRGPEAEELLGNRGYTIGHRPQSFHFASIGGFAAVRSSGQASAGYGRFDECVVGLRVATCAGTIELGWAPKSGAGPDLRHLFLGSEGALGVITAVRVEVRPLPEAQLYEGWRFDSFPEGLRALRRLAQDGPRPTVLRLADEVETAFDRVRPGGLGRDGSRGGVGSGRPSALAGCLAITGYEGTAAEVGARHERVGMVLRSLGGKRCTPAGEEWLRDRYRTPYLRDALLNVGILAETLETASFWSNLPVLYEQVRTALIETLTRLGTPPVVLCHVSHVYRSGASLYFTVGAAQLEDPLVQWSAAKAAASDAILACGGTISHHHGVGADHREHYGRQIGALSVGILRAVKDTLDPAGILNPGVLMPVKRLPDE